MNSPPDYYKILEIPETDDIKIIRQAYRRLAALYHPDRNKSPDAAARFHEITAAYHVLSDSQLRAQYRFQRRYENLTPEECTIEVPEQRPYYDESHDAKLRQATYVNDPWLTGLNAFDNDWRDHLTLNLARFASFLLFLAYIVDWFNQGKILQPHQFNQVHQDLVGIAGILLGVIALGLIGAPASRKSRQFYATFWQRNLTFTLRATGWVLLCSFPFLSWQLSSWLA